jgi:hypothetical protein
MHGGGIDMVKPLRMVPQAAQEIEFSCPLCGSVHGAYVFGTSQFRIYRCAGCALTFSRRPSRAKASSATVSQPPVQAIRRSERQHSNLIAALNSYSFDGLVLVVATPDSDIIPLIERCGIKIGRVVEPGDFGSSDWGSGYKGAIVSDDLMRVADPKSALLKVRAHLAANAPLVLSLPMVDGRQARLMGRNWHEWQSSNLWYFNRETLNLLLLATGFEQVWFQNERRRYSLDNLADRLSRIADNTSWWRGINAVRRVLPSMLRNKEFHYPAGTAVITARATTKRSENLVSIVVPVFNERATLQAMMDTLLAKQLPGLRKEIIVVESNSTDGSRELAQTYAGHPDVQILLQPGPNGKGNAVREGLKAATGDILMIQDADLEYDFDDYEGLLAPLLAWQTMFVLGSRHQGGWKMRKFNDEPITAAVFNLGHWFFKSLMNMMLNTQMSDPFTMFKLFRRDGLYGVDLISNRFDLDIELVIKLVRKGYVPLELPVNYFARSFAEGKKVSVSQDGVTWAWKILKFCLSPIGTRPQ